MKTTDSYEPDALTELEPSSPELTPPRRRWGLVVALLLVGLAVAAAVIFGGILPKLKAREQLRVQTDQLAVPTVSVISMKPSNAQQEVVLPANIQPYISAPIFARTNGYLKSWTSDIGAHVKKGQLLAEIETPEVDAQLRQAQADLATAQANLHLSEVTGRVS